MNLSSDMIEFDLGSQDPDVSVLILSYRHVQY